MGVDDGWNCGMHYVRDIKPCGNDTQPTRRWNTMAKIWNGGGDEVLVKRGEKLI